MTMHVEHHLRDKAHVTMTTERPNNDDGERRRHGRQGQGDGKAVYARYGSSVQAMTEQKMRRLVNKSTERYVIHNGQVLTPEAVKHMKNRALVHVVDKLPGGGKKKGQRKQSQAHHNKVETSSSESVMFFAMIQKGGHKGDDLLQTLMQVDEGTVQEIMSRKKRAVVVEGGAFGTTVHRSRR